MLSCVKMKKCLIFIKAAILAAGFKYSLKIKKVAEKGKKSPYLAKPLFMAAIACSLMPKCKFLPATKSPKPFNSVLFDGAKSALPPKKPTTLFAIAFKISPFESLVAMSLPLKFGYSTLLKSGFKSSFKSSFLGEFCRISLHFACAKSPSSTALSKRIFTSAGISK